MLQEHPYREWLDEHLVGLDDLPDAPELPEPDHETVEQRQQAFGYTFEDLRKVLEPMAGSGVEPIASMGYDAPLAVLSERPQRLYNYFKQMFAQVTNPPIDAIREEIITATGTTLGPERNLLNPEPESCRHIRLASPVLSNEEFAKLRHVRRSASSPSRFRFCSKRQRAKRESVLRLSKCVKQQTALLAKVIMY